MTPIWYNAHDDSSVTNAEADAAFDMGFDAHGNGYVLADNPHTNYRLNDEFVAG